MIDGMVARKLLTRQTSSSDRRITSTLTARSRSVLQSAYQGTQARLAEIVTAIPAAERAVTVQAMQALRPALTPQLQHDRREAIHGQSSHQGHHGFGSAGSPVQG